MAKEEKEVLLRKLGTEKLKYFKNNFDKVVDKYIIIARATGYDGELVFKNEHGKMVIFVKL